MSSNSMAMKPPSVIQEDAVSMNMESLNCLIPMGITSENVAQRFKVSRAEQDAFAVESHRRAAEATFGADKRFADEILPIATTWKDPKTGVAKAITVDKDYGIRASREGRPEGTVRCAIINGVCVSTSSVETSSARIYSHLLSIGPIARCNVKIIPNVPNSQNEPK